MFLDFNFQIEEIVISGKHQTIYFSTLKIDQILIQNIHSIYTLWHCDNKSTDDLCDIPLEHPILKLKYEKCCLFWIILQMVYFRTDLLKIERGFPTPYVTETYNYIS